MSSSLSRRGLFSFFARPFQAQPQTSPTRVETVSERTTAGPSQPTPAKVAVIQGRFCLAYSSFCSVCSERCPVPGAIQVEHGIPIIVPATCTGCGVCHDVCPAPKNAVLMIPRRRVTGSNLLPSAAS